MKKNGERADRKMRDQYTIVSGVEGQRFAVVARLVIGHVALVYGTSNLKKLETMMFQACLSK